MRKTHPTPPTASNANTSPSGTKFDPLTDHAYLSENPDPSSRKLSVRLCPNTMGRFQGKSLGLDLRP